MYLDNLYSSAGSAANGSATATVADQPTIPSVDTQALIEQHLHLVRSAVARIKRTVPAHVDADDLYSIGLAGLVSAVHKFNPIQGRTFAGFATLRIRGAMLDELRRLDTCSRRARARARQLRSATNNVEQQLGRPATDEDVRANLGLDRQEYRKWVEDAKPVGFVALDRTAGTDESTGSSLHDLIADDHDQTARSQMEQSELVELLTERIAELPDLQRRILSMYYFENMRIAEIAKSFGVTSSRISQVHTRALTELREWLAVARDH